MDYTNIEDFSNAELIEELEIRGCRMCDLGYDIVDVQLYDDIVEKFDSLDCFSRQKLRDLVINFTP